MRWPRLLTVSSEAMFDSLQRASSFNRPLVSPMSEETMSSRGRAAELPTCALGLHRLDVTPISYACAYGSHVKISYTLRYITATGICFIAFQDEIDCLLADLLN